jgi:hypothetical protein
VEKYKKRIYENRSAVVNFTTYHDLTATTAENKMFYAPTSSTFSCQFAIMDVIINMRKSAIKWAFE